MPRVVASDNSPLDFCRRHFPDEEAAQAEYGNVGDGPNNRGNCFAYQVEHPEYDDPAIYVCETCGCELTDKDH